LKLVDRYSALLDEEGLLKEEKERVKAAIVEYCESFGYEVVFGADRRVSLKKFVDIVFPTAKDARRRELELIIEESGRWNEFSSLNLTKLKKALQAGKIPEPLAVQLEPYYTEEEATRIYSTRQKQDD